jgi:hypothetical protein
LNPPRAGQTLGRACDKMAKKSRKHKKGKMADDKMKDEKMKDDKMEEKK